MLSKLNNGAVEKIRTSTGVTPQRPQRCASTNSATTALVREPRFSKSGWLPQAKF